MAKEAHYVLPDRVKYADYRKAAVAYCQERGIPIPKPRPSKPL